MLKQDLSAIVDMIANMSLFSSVDDPEAFREFLSEEIYKFYNHAPLKIKEFIEGLSEDKFLKALYLKNMGIEDDYIDNFLTISLGLVGKYFIEKGDELNLVNLESFFVNLGYNVEFYKTSWDSAGGRWTFTRVSSGQTVTAEYFNFNDHEDFITPGHVVYTSEYAAGAKTDYIIPVVVIRYSQSIDIEGEYTPPSLLVAYALSKYSDSNIVLYTGNVNTTVALKMFLLIARYVYLKWLQMRNTGFDIGGVEKEFWYLERDEDFIDEAHDLLIYLYTEVDAPQKFDTYVRQATLLLNNYMTTKGSGTIEDIRNFLASFHPDIINIIDSFISEEDFKSFVNYMKISLYYFIQDAQVQAVDIVDKKAIKTIIYLFNIVYYSISELNMKMIEKMFFVYKKYFLPVYTEKKIDFDNAFKIKNNLMKFYIGDKIMAQILKKVFSFEKLRDIEKTESIIKLFDKLGKWDSVHREYFSVVNDIITIRDIIPYNLLVNIYSRIVASDTKNIEIMEIHKNILSLFESYYLEVNNSFKDLMKSDDKIVPHLGVRSSEYIDLMDIRNIIIDVLDKDRAHVYSDDIINILFKLQENLDQVDEILLEFYTHVGEVLGSNDDVDGVKVENDTNDTNYLDDNVEVTKIQY